MTCDEANQPGKSAEPELFEEERNPSVHLTFSNDGKVGKNGSWKFLPEQQILKLNIEGEFVEELIVFAGHDWENKKKTVLFSGLDDKGCSVWGKKIGNLE